MAASQHRERQSTRHRRPIRRLYRTHSGIFSSAALLALLAGLLPSSSVRGTGGDLLGASSLPAAADQEPNFAADIQPLLEAKCLDCHGSKRPKAGFRLNTREHLLDGGDRGAAVLLGNSGDSPLIHYVAGAVPDLEMPPAGKAAPLTDEEIGRLRAWIDGGASWPLGVALDASAEEGAPADPPEGSADLDIPEIDRPVDFASEVFPILRERCFDCHGPAKQKAGLRLDSRAVVFRGGNSGPSVVARDPWRSHLFRRVAEVDGEDRMPPKGDALRSEDIGLVRAWIEQGAVWPENVGARSAEVRRHWAYVAPARPEPPPVKHPAWIRNPIDGFVLARLEQEGLSPSPEADRTTIIRRVSLDLIGLPPSPREVDAFVLDNRPDTYERLVERLLASSHYGERWAKPWLDLARYADTNGYEKDDRRSIWLYRDWVIHSLNADMPFDRFTIEQLAGDLLPEATVEQRIATGFHRNSMVNTEGGTDEEEFRVAAVIDRVNTTFTVWMGTTLGCAQCHNHKYDPFTQEEYFQVFALLNQTNDRGRSNDPILEVPTPEQAAELARIDAELKPLDAILDTHTPELQERQRAWESSLAEDQRCRLSNWRPIVPTEAHASGGVSLEVSPDFSITASAENPSHSVYRISAMAPHARISAIRLEALPDPSLPEGGAGLSDIGNFLLTEVSVEARPVNDRLIARGERPTLGAWFSTEPFPAETRDAAFRTAFAPEKGVSLTGAGIDPAQSWLARPEFTDGEVHALGGEKCATYLFRTITAPESMPVMVSLGSDDGIKAWLNSREVLSNNASRAVTPDRERVRLDLKEGKNELLLKIVNGSGDHGFYFAVSKDQDAIYRVPLKRAYANVEPKKYSPDSVIDDDPKTGWALGDLNEAHSEPGELTVVSRKPFGYAGGTRLVVRLRHEAREQHLLGRFRLSYSTSPIDSHNRTATVPAKIRRLLGTDGATRTDEHARELAKHYRSIDPELEPTRKRAKELEGQKPKDIRSTLVMEAVEEARETRVFERGSFLSPGDEVQARSPVALHPWPQDQPRNRLGLAHWLVDPSNPLVGRVTLNRIWAQYFGRGIVTTSEDFGAQGDSPSHPRLLDWLATEFVRQGWSLKAMHRLIVTSATYRQSSRVTPELIARDPYNRWLARGPRFRMEAEMIRDTALATSGILHRKIGGPSVFPFQPGGVWSNPYSADQWKTDTDGNEFRRGLYTFWRRTAPYAAFMTFDAPSREVCTERRARTNTPLQALVTLNDPAFLAASAGLARRIALEGGDTVPQRIDFAFRCCTSRTPRVDERTLLLDLYEAARTRFREDPAAATALANSGGLEAEEASGVDPIDLAAWTVIANVLLNLDETLTKG